MDMKVDNEARERKVEALTERLLSTLDLQERSGILNLLKRMKHRIRTIKNTSTK